MDNFGPHFYFTVYQFFEIFWRGIGGLGTVRP